MEEGNLANAVQEAVIAGFVQTDQRDLLAPFTAKYFDAVKDVFDSRSHEIAQQIVVGLYPALQVSQATLDATDAWLTETQPSPALRRMVTESRAGCRTRPPGPTGRRGSGRVLTRLPRRPLRPPARGRSGGTGGGRPRVTDPSAASSAWARASGSPMTSYLTPQCCRTRGGKPRHARQPAFSPRAWRAR